MESKKGKKVRDVRGTSGQCLRKGNGKWQKKKGGLEWVEVTKMP